MIKVFSIIYLCCIDLDTLWWTQILIWMCAWSVPGGTDNSVIENAPVHLEQIRIHYGRLRCNLSMYGR